MKNVGGVSDRAIEGIGGDVLGKEYAAALTILRMLRAGGACTGIQQWRCIVRSLISCDRMISSGSVLKCSE